MKLEANLISGRTAYQGAYLEAKTHKEYFDACSYCELNSSDLAKLGVFIPMGPWANAVLSPDTHGCGMPGFKGVPAQIEKTGEAPLEMKALMRQYYE
jgi:formylmethanofuran dehydrogenase subunit D